MVGAMTIADSQTDKYHILKETFGFDAFRPGQEAVVDAVLGGDPSIDLDNLIPEYDVVTNRTAVQRVMDAMADGDHKER